MMNNSQILLLASHEVPTLSIKQLQSCCCKLVIDRDKIFMPERDLTGIVRFLPGFFQD